MVELKTENGEYKRFSSLKRCAEYLLQTGYKNVKRVEELPMREREEYNMLPAIRVTKAGYIQVIVK